MKWSQVAADVRQGSGLSADGIASSGRNGPTLEPGKATLVERLPNRAHHGACTHLGPEAPGCYLDDDARRDYVGDLSEGVMNALTNFKLAVQSVRMKELLRKEEELDWFTGLIIDVASAFLGSAIGKALKKVRTLGAETMFERGLKHAGTAEAHMFQRADTLLRGVSDARLDAWTKAAFDPIKKRGQSAARNVSNEGAPERSSDVEAFLKGLATSADVAYRGFLKRMKADATDSELAVALQAMEVEYHTQDLYEDALAAKLERYKTSRVRDIGRKLAKDEQRITTVARETRVVWVVNGKQSGKRLHYQYQEGGVRSFEYGGEDPGIDYAPKWVMDMMPPWFGVGSNDVTMSALFRGGRDDTKLGSPVPEEFVELALARSEALYGVTTVVDLSDERAQGSVPDRWRPKAITDAKQSSTSDASGKQGPRGARPFYVPRR